MLDRLYCCCLWCVQVCDSVNAVRFSTFIRLLVLLFFGCFFLFFSISLLFYFIYLFLVLKWTSPHVREVVAPLLWYYFIFMFYFLRQSPSPIWDWCQKDITYGAKQSLHFFTSTLALAGGMPHVCSGTVLPQGFMWLAFSKSTQRTKEVFHVQVEHQNIYWGQWPAKQI